MASHDKGSSTFGVAVVYLQGMYRPFLLALALAWAFLLQAQPPNDDCASAATLCAQQPINASNAGATGTPTGFCPNTSNAIWYTFSTNSQGGVVNIEVNGIDCPTVPGVGDGLTAVVLSGDGSCTPASFTSVSNCVSGTDEFTVVTDPLLPDSTYWLLIAGNMGTTSAAECDFSIGMSGPGADVLGVDLIVSDDIIIGTGESTQLHVIGGTNPVWSPTTGLSNANIADPIASPTATTTYTITAEVNGCTYTDQVIVELVRRILPVNTFTPNGDGINDQWDIVGIDDYPGAEILIFDRWGQRVYASTGYREPWDGTFNGAKLPDATYYYHIQLNQLEGRAPPYTGFISIVR